MSNVPAPQGYHPLLFEYLFSGVVVHAPDTRIVFANAAAARLLGLSPDLMPGKAATDAAWSFVREDGTPMPVDEYPVNRVLATGQPLLDLVMGLNRPATGDQVWVLVRAFPEFSAQQVLQQIVVAFIDITARKRAEAALQESERRYRELVQEANSAIIRWACDGTVLFFNEYAQSLFGYRPEEIVGQPVSLLVPATESTGSDLSQLIADIVTCPERFVNVINENVCHDGRRVWMAWTNKPIRDPQGQVTAILAVGNDITERKRAEDALRASEARRLADEQHHVARLQQLNAQEQQARAQAEESSRLKDEFLATVSHELRTPLTAVLGYAQLLQRHTGDEAYVTHTVAKMVESAKIQASLIEDLLDVTRIVSGKLRLAPAPTSLITVIHAALDTVRLMLEAKKLALHVDLDPGASAVVGDASRLQQVVWNLLTNAIKFTPPHGDIAVRLARHRGQAELSVRDTGQGIHPDFLPSVFERFRQADSSSHRAHGGLGLGLTIVHQLVELHGGTVEATSAGLGQGTTFTVRLPLANAREAIGPDPAATRDMAVSDAGPPLFAGLRVLVVDDQPAIRELLEEILGADGAVVRGCASAPAALALVRAWHPDVLVSDIAMPEDDGYWLIQQVRDLAPEEGGAVPAIALTAYVRIEDRLRALAAGFQQYVPKPVDAAELRDVIRGLIATGPQRSSAAANRR